MAEHGPPERLRGGVPRPRPRAFHVMAKPAGPACNLHCTYCFYLEKERLYPSPRRFRMSDAVLEAFIKQYIEAQQVPTISFAWQGGEPTLMGLPFFRRVVELQRRYQPPGKRLINALQTNGTLLTDEWCAFLREHQFLVGLSLDGPRGLHDHYRRGRRGEPTFDAVMRGLRRLQQHGVEYNLLCAVNRVNGQQPLAVYRFLRETGARHLQFIPIVERLAAEPPLPGQPPSSREVSEASVRPAEYGEFLCAVYDEWVRHDVGRIYVQTFEVALSVWLGHGAGLCVFEPTCGRGMALEHNGDLYACDHYVYPEYRLGNLMEQPLVALAESNPQRRFGTDKRDTLPRQCRECPVLFLCNGECPKNRFLQTPEGEEGLNYLCAGLKRFFTHIGPTLEWMARALQQGQPAAGIMAVLRQADQGSAGPPATEVAVARRPGAGARPAGRTAPCPCGSGQKSKRCCGRGQ